MILKQAKTNKLNQTYFEKIELCKRNIYLIITSDRYDNEYQIEEVNYEDWINRRERWSSIEEI